MFWFNIFLSYMIVYICVLVCVAFVTLMEQKILGSIQVRVGPNKVGYWGMLQPFADAVKLFSKENLSPRMSNLSIYYMAPSLGLFMSLSMWILFPLNEGGLDFFFGLFFFICVSGLAVYPILMSGWSSNSKYSMLGSLRAVAQMISYEVSLAMVLLSVVWLVGSFQLSLIMEFQMKVYNLFFFFPLSLIWFASSLAEANRSPYDFAEGESELVSGFNTEYSAGGFTLIFMAEYASIMFMGVLFSIMFISGGEFSFFTVFKGILVVFWFIWVRGSLPRFRYDKLMYLAWKSFLPITLMFFIFYLSVGFFMNLFT